MNEDGFKQKVKSFLRDIGLTAHDISEEGDSETPDFDVEGENTRYTIELKIKSDDPEEIKKDLEVLSRGKILSKSTPVGPRNRLYGIVKKGVQQMEEHDPGKMTYHVLWIHSAGRDPNLLNTRFHATLFGTQDLFSLNVEPLMTCYYFNESAFFTHRNSLDGVILTYSNQLQLCVNTLSPRANEFRDSELYKNLSKGLCDPDILKKEEGVLIADCDVDRKDSNAVVQYLREIYKIDHLQTIDLAQHSGMISVPNKKE